MNRPIIIAEIGCNHQGSLKKAKEMIKIASTLCNADVVKFQKRNPKELLSEKEYNKPHPVEQNAFGSSYGQHREFLELDIKQHEELLKSCKKNKINYSSSIWDLTSAKEIISLKPKLIKIPSALNLHFELLEYLCKNYNGEIHISLGMTSKKEEKEIVKLITKHKKNSNLVLYACTSGYPVINAKDISLLEISRLKKDYKNKIKSVGFSGHHKGIAIDIAAMTLGAEYIERHFTLDRTLKGTDHAASLEPDGFRKLVRDINFTHNSLVFKQKDILEIEKAQRKKLKYEIN